MSGGERTYFVRLNRFHRLMHFVVMTSFLGLAVTGLPLKYSETLWARYFVSLLGGFEYAGLLHRICAVVTFGYFAAHIVYLVHFFRFKSDQPFFSFLLGPDSMVPNLKDLKDLWGNVKWFLGLGPKPRFDRWTYWEKFDYWAVFWGVGMIGVSGLFLWFPTFFARFLPGWTLNIASIVHSDEALLATGFIFIFHFIHTHLRGDKFPLDPVIFTGSVSDEEMRDERPAEYERRGEKGELVSIRTVAPALWLRIAAWLIGFLALAIGITTIVLVLSTLRG